jgi:hypothetical protein
MEQAIISHHSLFWFGSQRMVFSAHQQKRKTVRDWQ